jgi:hypothetical protein
LLAPTPRNADVSTLRHDVVPAGVDWLSCAIAAMIAACALALGAPSVAAGAGASSGVERVSAENVAIPGASLK